MASFQKTTLRRKTRQKSSGCFLSEVIRRFGEAIEDAVTAAIGVQLENRAILTSIAVAEDPFGRAIQFSLLSQSVEAGPR